MYEEPQTENFWNDGPSDDRWAIRFRTAVRISALRTFKQNQDQHHMGVFLPNQSRTRVFSQYGGRSWSGVTTEVESPWRNWPRTRSRTSFPGADTKTEEEKKPKKNTIVLIVMDVFTLLQLERGWISSPCGARTSFPIEAMKRASQVSVRASRRPL